MRKKSKRHVFMKIGTILLVGLITFGLLHMFKSGKTSPQASEDQSGIRQSAKEKPVSSEKDYPAAIVPQIRSLSEEGKVLHTPFIAGETPFTELKKEWGLPRDALEYAAAYYADYPDHHVTVGYKNDLIFDVRSFHSELQTIHMNEIKKAMGDPDDVRFYKDETHDQIILVYQVNPTYQLKWILPKPTDVEPNPVVDHISVYTPMKNKKTNEQGDRDTIAEMSINEKIGQMIVAGLSGTELDDQTEALITKYKVGGFIFYSENMRTANQTVQFLNEIKSENDTIPLLLGVDQEGGRISRLPGPITNLPANQQIGEVDDPQFSNKIGHLLGKELNAFGFNLDFAPVLDINSNPDNPIIGDRSFGDNADVVSRLGTETMRGLQKEGIIPVIKHFPGHGDTSVDSHLELPTVNKSLAQLKESELVPFSEAIDDGADVVMAAHILLPEIDDKAPASMSKTLITDVLRNQLGFSGVVITDDMTMGAITENYDIGQAAVQSVKAGSDIILVAHDYDKVVGTIKALRAAVENGEISEERIDESVERILHLKKKYQVNHKPVGPVDFNSINESIAEVLDEFGK